MLRRASALLMLRVSLALRDAGDAFERYPEIDNSTSKRIEALRQAGTYDDEWIATEKVHGANFGVYSTQGGRAPLQFAKRSGIMPPTEHFFGYHVLIPELTQQMDRCRALLQERLGFTPDTVLLNGELFGGKYEHPSVPRVRRTVMVGGRQRTVTAVQRDPFPQYSPDLHFYAFDLKFRAAAADDYHTLTYDAATDIFARVEGLLYARAVVRGTMAKIAAFDVERFQTTIPPLVGMGDYPLQGNWAEGIVVRHARRGEVGFAPPGFTLIKIKSTAFHEITTDRAQGPRTDEMLAARLAAIGAAGVQLPDLATVVPDAETLAAARLLLRHVSERRLDSVLSKLGSAPFESEELGPDGLAELLAADALKDFLKEAAPAVVKAPLLTRREMARHVLLESRRLVCAQWRDILERQRGTAGG